MRISEVIHPSHLNSPRQFILEMAKDELTLVLDGLEALASSDLAYDMLDQIEAFVD